VNPVNTCAGACQPNPEDQKKLAAARKTTPAKRAASAAVKREQELKEQQYIASLPKLRGPSQSVLQLFEPYLRIMR
jgi:hypothetical protein